MGPKKGKRVENLLLERPFRVDQLIVQRELVGNYNQMSWNVPRLKSDAPAVSQRQEPPQKGTEGS